MSKLGIRGFANLLPSFMTPLRKNQKDKRHVICVLQTFSINFKYNVYRLVLFVGGYTMAEVAAFRWLQAATGFFLSNYAYFRSSKVGSKAILSYINICLWVGA